MQNKMIDGDNTSFDWQTHSGDICVLPIGSFEQHGAHLPLTTDIIGAEYFARMAAEGLGAALLPALPFGTCMEHSGFRGSVSLRPETLMQTVRDIADQMEKQNFRVLLIVNGHGGNFVLGPVVRDINRCDRSLKILLVNWYDFRDPSLFPQVEDHGSDFHAGEMETSLMMALRPKLVGDERSDMPSSKGQDFPLSQPDLNTFGVGHFAPEGAVGYPSLATKEKGEAVIAGVRERMLSYLRDRIERLHKQPKYSGSGGITLRTLTENDIEAAMRLKVQAGWNQTENDWRFFLNRHPDHCFAAVHNGQVVGTTTVVRHGAELAWIGMVLVDSEFRRMGIASRLVQRALESARDCNVIGLDATAAGKQIYDRLGFVDEFSATRLVHPHAPLLSPADGVLTLQEKHWPAVLELDRRVFGADRSQLLRALYEIAPKSAWCFVDKGEVRGFCLARSGANFHHIGPVIAHNFETAKALLQSALSTQRGQAVGLDVADSQSEFLQWLDDAGFSRQRSFMRMTCSDKSMPGVLTQQFALVGPEFA